MEPLFKDATKQQLKAALDVCAFRHRLILNNIANADTPGYKRKVLLFEEALREAEEKRASGVELERFVAEDQSPGRADGNNVSIDIESALLAENAMTYEAIITMLSLRGRWLGVVLGEGGS
jgi:flagellar basal-body rod protein FlgB